MTLSALASAAGAEARLEISGEVQAAGEGQLQVRVGLKNVGDTTAGAVRLTGELFDHVESVRLDAEIGPGESRSAALLFPFDEASPGVHAVALRLEYQSSRVAGAAERTLLQPAYVLLALGENATPAVRIDAPTASMDSVGRWTLGLESLDGAAHRVRLRAVLPRNLRAAPANVVVEVPARGRVQKELLLFRVDAPWQSEQGVVLLAATEGETPTRTSAATAVVRVGPEPARLPGLRTPLAVVMLLLFVAAALVEVRRRRQSA